MAPQNRIPIVIADLRGGRNSSDPPLSIPDDQCVEALNVDWWTGTFAHKRPGAVALSTASFFSGTIGSLIRHVPGADETAAEFWAIDSNLVLGRLVASTTWASITEAADTKQSALDWVGLSFAGSLFLAYNSSGNRLHLWDATLAKERRAGLATPDPPTVATNGGAGLTLTRFYRIRTVDISGSVTRRRSEASTVVTISITDDVSVRVTRPTLPTNENETHWEVEYADAATGPWYRASQVATGTTFYDDAAATISTTNLSAVDGTNWPPPSAKYLVKNSGRVVMAGCYETSGGYTTPSNVRVWWTPPSGALDVGDSERVPTGYSIDVESAITGLGVQDGNVIVFGYRSMWALIPTGLTGANAYQRVTLREDIGCIRQQTIVSAEDENGAPCLYWYSHKGPYRMGPNGIQYLGNDSEDVWSVVNLDATTVVAHACPYLDKHQVWFYVATGSSNEPDLKLAFDTRLGRNSGESVYKGWAKHTSASVAARCSCLFSSTVGATMSRALKPHIGQSQAVNRIWKCDSGTDDGGTDFQSYIDTKPYMPAGWGKNVRVDDPQLVAEASSGVTITVSPLSDFGLASTQAGTCSLTAAGSETRVQRRVEGLQTAGAGAIAFRVGDSAAFDGSWTIDALIAHAQPQEERS